MAGIPWVIVFILIALLARSRGWSTVFMVAVFCVGVGAAGTSVGAAIYGGATALLGGLWHGITGLIGGVA